MTKANHLQINSELQQDLFSEYPYTLRSKENVAKLLISDIKQWDKFQLAIQDVAYKRLLPNATGSLLDDIGGRLNLKRYNQTDDAFRATIRLRSLRQTSNGSRGDIVELLNIFFNGATFYFNKGGLGFVDLTVPKHCFDQGGLAKEVEDLFPANTNLHIKEMGDEPYMGFIDAKDSLTPNGMGGFSDAKNPDTVKDGKLTDWFFSSKNGYYK